MTLAIPGVANVYPNAARPDVNTLSQGWRWSRRSDGANEPEPDKRGLNPHELLLSAFCSLSGHKNTQGARSFRGELPVAFTSCNAFERKAAWFNGDGNSQITISIG
jgi:hypothetical protein